MEFIDEAIQHYADAMTEPETELLASLNRETHMKVMQPRMLSGHFQGRLLSMLSHMLQPKRILEIGTYTGYSALCLAEGLAEDGELHTIDINAEQEKRIRSYFERSPRAGSLHLHIGNALEIIPGLQAPFDIVFIDADKSNYLNYFNLVADKMVPGGLIIADNVLWSGKILDEKERTKDKDTAALHEFNTRVSADPRFQPVLLPVRDGLMLLRRKR
ncbi:MAG: O-methyltransferase [Bacteroidia bacterium]|nr:O-methyltransferase [Bacteroidia bacterium]